MIKDLFDHCWIFDARDHLHRATTPPVAKYAATVVVTPIDASSSSISWSGIFEPVGISEAQAETIVAGIYKGGIARTQRRLGL